MKVSCKRVFLVRDASAYFSAVSKYGAMIAPSVAALLAGVRRERIYRLIEAGRLIEFNCFGQAYVGEIELREWMCSRRYSS